MGGLSLWHWVIVALVVLVLFGRGKISETMGDFGRGIKSFKKGMAEEDTSAARPAPPPQISSQADSAPAATPAPSDTEKSQ